MFHFIWFVRGVTALGFLNHEKGKRRTFLLHRQRIRNSTFPTKWINGLQNCYSHHRWDMFDAAVSFGQLRGTCVFIQQRFDQPHKKGLREICIAVMKRSFTRYQKDVYKKKKKKKKNRSRVSDRSSVCAESRLSRMQRDGWDALRVAGRAPLQPRCLQARAGASLSDSFLLFWSFYSTWNIKMRSGNTHILWCLHFGYIWWQLWTND